LTDDKRAELESLVRSTKTEYRTRLKVQIVLMAADGAATRAIAREVGCAIRIVSKWRMRYARDRLAGFDETGNRGPETGRRILALLDTKPPSGYANWTGSFIARTLCDVHEQYVWRFLRAQNINLSGRKILVREQRSGVRGESGL
jgi:transposase-like protein